MEKIKDFIYDKNDILVALLVLALAALLIFWRMDVIMEYPEKIFAAEEQEGSGATDVNPDDEQEGGQLDGDAAAEGDGSNDGSSDGGEDSAEPSGGLWQGGALTRDVEVDVYGNSAMAAVQCLVDEGLFEDYNEYKEICDRTGLNHEKVSAGSLLFEKGSTKEEVARKINWS